MGPAFSASRRPELKLTRERAQQSWDAWLGMPPPGTAALTQRGPILQKPMPAGGILPVSVGRPATVPAMLPRALQPRKTSTSWALLTVTLNPTTPASAGGRNAEKNVS